ncbi:uncharacterized protein LOC144704396 isoform X2 [Wolffia australiana]
MPENIRKRSSKWDLLPEEQAQPTILVENDWQAATHAENVTETSKNSSNSSRDVDEQNIKDRSHSNPRSRSRSRSRERDRNDGYGRKRSRSRSPTLSSKRNEGDDKRPGPKPSHRNDSKSQTEERQGETGTPDGISSKSKPTRPYSAMGHESSDGILGQPPQYLMEKKYLGFSQDSAPAPVHHDPGVDRNGRSIRGSDCIVIDTLGSTAEERERIPGMASFSNQQIGQSQTKFVMPFLRPGEQGVAGPVPVNGPAQFIIPPRAPSLQGFHMAESPKLETQIQLPYQNAPSLYNRQPLQIPFLQGQSQLARPLTPQTVNSSDSIFKGHPQTPILQGLIPRPETPKMEALKPADDRLSSLSASLSQIFGNGHQLPQLYAALNPQHGSGLVGESFSRQLPQSTAPSNAADHGKGDGHQLHQLYAALNRQPGSKLVDGLVSQQPPQSTTPPSITDHSKRDVSRMSLGLPSKPSEQKPAPVRETPKETKAGVNGGREAKKTKETKETKVTEETKETKVTEETKETKVTEETKETKGLKVFKCTLVEFVKEVLRPTWKEGQMSKEAHKTIVKKTVEKVITTLEGNVPHTKERIDLYMSYSKDKLTKLVQAYLEKYMKT